LGLLFAGTIAVFAFGWPLLVIIALLSFVLSQAIFIALAFFFRCHCVVTSSFAVVAG